MVVEVDAAPDNDVVVRWMSAEAKLRRVPPRIITSGQPAQLMLTVAGTRL